MSPLEIQRYPSVARAASTSTAQSEMPSPDVETASGRVAPDRRDQGIAVEVHGELASKGPPIDNDRVVEIRAALKDGSYPLLPTEIADALIASKLTLAAEK